MDKPDSTQTFFCFGNLGITQTNPDRVYIEVTNTLFGGRFTSMLNAELRINSGLTYGAYSYFDLLKTRGLFTAASYTPNATTEKALDLALRGDYLKAMEVNSRAYSKVLDVSRSSRVSPTQKIGVKLSPRAAISF